MSSDRISWVNVHKAVSSEETAPKPKHVRKIIVATWKTNGGGVFYQKLVQEPLSTSSLVAWKSLITIHHILQSGAPKFIYESHQKIGLFSNLENIWSKSSSGYASLVAYYAAFLRDKVNFHQKNPEFDGTMELNSYLKKTEGRFDPDRSIQLIQMFLNMQEDILKLQIAVFNSTPLNECRVSALIPLVKEAYAIYTHLVHHFKKLGEVLDSLDSIGKLTERFYAQYINLRTFFERATKIRYVATTIAVPILPKDPPTFVVKGRAPTVVRQSVIIKQNEKPAAPVPVPIPVVQVRQQLGADDMERAIATATVPSALPISNISITPYANRPSDGSSGNDPLFLRLRTTHPSAYTPFGPYPERKAEIPSSWTRFSSPVATGVAVAPAGASADLKDGTERELAELRSRLQALLDAAQKEKERNAHLEEQIANRDAALAKWKDAYGELLKAHDSINAEREQLHKDKHAAEQRLADYMSNQASQLRGLTVGELDDAMRALERALYNLDNPDFAGNERATPDDVNESTIDLIAAIDKAVDAWSRGSEPEMARAVKILGGKASSILVDAKGVARLSDDPLVKQALFDAARLAAASTQRLLDLLRNSPDDKEAIAEATAAAKRDAREVEKAIEALIKAEQVEGHTENSDDLTDIASQELLKAAKIIEDAVAALTATAKARANKPKSVPEGEVDIADAILDASLAISRATATLVASASQAQKEFVAAGKASPNPSTFYAKSRTFSEGLISAAQAVAAATAELVKQANGVATGKIEEEGLIAASKAVSAATKQLVVASRVKADPNSPSQKKLEEASSAVAQATQALVAAARALAKKDVDEAPVIAAGGLAGSKIQEMEQQMKILRLEKDLEAARNRLARIRKQEYSGGKK